MRIEPVATDALGIAKYLKLDSDPSTTAQVAAVHRLRREHGLPAIPGTRPLRFHVGAVDEWARSARAASDEPDDNGGESA